MASVYADVFGWRTGCCSWGHGFCLLQWQSDMCEDGGIRMEDRLVHFYRVLPMAHLAGGLDSKVLSPKALN
ncbi:UNVERIFIED_CONTAM: hypothetical protein Sangu_1190800 [Sesamum angustifolium]|uniref:Uncharacterized protein n=1 Tax=Sesamum angustifolium TaxID=2727405 RepID=A0AAW2NHI0_9LAMI